MEKDEQKSKETLFKGITLLVVACSFFALYSAVVTFRAHDVYEFLKANGRGFTGHIHKADAELGYVPVEDSRGSGYMVVGEPVPVVYDSRGFRVPVRHPGPPRVANGEDGKSVLALGDSYTFGQGVDAEEAYVARLGDALGLEVMNAGVPGYGIAQMVLRARDVIPRYKPDIVVVQYSPWLISRSMRVYAPVYFGKVPAPYYSDDGMRIVPPLFITNQGQLDYDMYRESSPGLLDFGAFMIDVGFPLFFHQDVNVVIASIRDLFGFVPEPTKYGEGVVVAAFEELSRLCKENNAVLVIVIIGKDQNMVVPFRFFPSDAVVVNARSALLSRLSAVTPEAYRSEYWVWRGRPLRLADNHPNALMHQIIATELADTLSEYSGPDISH